MFHSKNDVYNTMWMTKSTAISASCFFTTPCFFFFLILLIIIRFCIISYYTCNVYRELIYHTIYATVSYVVKIETVRKELEKCKFESAKSSPSSFSTNKLRERKKNCLTLEFSASIHRFFISTLSDTNVS